MNPWFHYPQFSWAEKHAIVIGAGIAGCQMTWHLSQLGWRVSLIEEESEISQKASGNLAGVISPKMTAQDSEGERFYRNAFNYTTQQLSKLPESSSIDWTPCGMLQLAHNPRELQRWEALRQRNLPSEFIQFPDKSESSAIAGLECGYPASYFPRAGFVNPASFCEGLLATSQCQIFHSSKVAQLRQDEEGTYWEAIDESGTLIQSAPVLVLCNGADLAYFEQSNFIPQTGVLGQTSHIDHTEAGNIHCVIGHEGYLTPAYKGVHVFGATFDRNYESATVTKQSDQRNLSQLSLYFPKLVKRVTALESGHAAVRSTTPDRYPYAGAVVKPDFYQQHYADLKHGRTQQVFPNAEYQKGLFVLGGFGSRGLTTSGYCANTLSQLINNQVSTEQATLLNTLHPARFLIRQLKRGII